MSVLFDYHELHKNILKKGLDMEHFLDKKK